MFPTHARQVHCDGILAQILMWVKVRCSSGGGRDFESMPQPCLGKFAFIGQPFFAGRLMRSCSMDLSRTHDNAMFNTTGATTTTAVLFQSENT